MLVRKTFSAIAFLSVLLCFAGCNKEKEEVSVTGVTLNKQTLTLALGDVETLKALVLPENATDRRYLWSTEDETIAFISYIGEVKGISIGTTTVSATTLDGGKVGSCVVTVVPVEVTGVSLNKTSITLGLGEVEKLQAIFKPANATNKNCEWTSSDETVATVEGGSVTGVGGGEAVITVTTVDGGFTATCDVTVDASGPVCLGSFNLEDEDELENWTVIDNDGDGYYWEWCTYEDLDLEDLFGTSLIISASWDKNALTPDNWAITPTFNVPEEGANVSLYAFGLDPDYAEEVFGIFVGQGEDVSGYEQIGEDFTVTPDPVLYCLDIPAKYNNTNDVRIAIVHHNISDMYYLCADAVSVYSGSSSAPSSIKRVNSVKPVRKTFNTRFLKKR